MNDCEAYGRTLSVPTENDVIFYSDRDVADPGTDVQDKIYQQMYDARYMVNICALKGHIRAGMTLFGKTHFGSHTEESAAHLHRGLVSPDDYGSGENQGYGKYRVLVDLLGHEQLGGKTVINILDALWGGDKHELFPPRKWDMAPFNGDYCSSIFASIDPIAASSVGHDFLRTEYSIAKYGDEAYPNFVGTDDHLQQAADSSKWPDNIIYDPENDGTPIKSLGTHEHWNNATDMEYTRNLGTGNGIELVKLLATVVIENPIADLILKENAADTTLDLSNVFHATLGDTVTYSVLSQTNDALVSASIDDSSLTLSFTSDMTGTDTITVQASAADRSITDQFVVTVNPATALAYNGDQIPTRYKLSQNYPNPFNPETTIGYALPKASDVTISIYDVNGRHVTDILNSYKSAGYHTIKWNASGQSSGLYFYRITAENFTQVKRCILVK
ncbi:MAG: T9SS type A sorting domain-containing protein [Calditrichaceae bacterium]